jgi:hypothetical protein
MILPRACLGKSSIEYLNVEDKTKPKSQTYRIFADMPLTILAAARSHGVIPAERGESRNP